MGYSTVVAGTTITASWANANVRDQVVTPFATTSARDSAIASPVEGMVCTITNTDYLEVYHGAWIDIGPLTAWASWSPTLTQSGSVTKTVSSGVYMRVGRLIVATCRLAVTGSGTTNNTITVSLPVNAADTSGRMGTGEIYDASGASIYRGIAVAQSATTVALRRTDGTSASYIGVDPNFALASGDEVNFHLTYQGAS